MRRIGGRSCNPPWVEQRLAEHPTPGLGAAGWLKEGDAVVALRSRGFYVNRGDVGKIIGPSEYDLEDWVSVSFVQTDDFPGETTDVHLNHLVALAEWPERQLEDASKVLAAGGWQIGDRVVSLWTAPSTDKVKRGDVGTIVAPVGPCDVDIERSEGDPSDPMRVIVEFEDEEGSLYPVSLQGRTELVSEEEWPAVQAEDASTVLAGGWRIGDRMVALLPHLPAHLGIVRGDIGTVIAPCRKHWDDEALYVYVDFHGKGRIDVIGGDPNFVAEAKWEEQEAADATLLAAAGLKIGDHVVLVSETESKSSVQKGDVGSILGPAYHNPVMVGGRNYYREEVLFVFFPRSKKTTYVPMGCVVPEAAMAQVFAAGGWRIGDRVVILVDHAPMNISRGDVGTIAGPSPQMAAAAAAADVYARRRARRRAPGRGAAAAALEKDFLLVDFGEGKGLINLLGTMDIVAEPDWPKRDAEDAAKVLAAGGWRIGDHVVSLGNLLYHGDIIKEGEFGIVLGPCDAEDYLLVDFGKGKEFRIVDGKTQIRSEEPFEKELREAKDRRSVLDGEEKAARLRARLEAEEARKAKAEEEEKEAARRDAEEKEQLLREAEEKQRAKDDAEEAARREAEEAERKRGATRRRRRGSRDRPRRRRSGRRVSKKRRRSNARRRRRRSARRTR